MFQVEEDGKAWWESESDVEAESYRRLGTNRQISMQSFTQLQLIRKQPHPHLDPSFQAVRCCGSIRSRGVYRGRQNGCYGLT